MIGFALFAFVGLVAIVGIVVFSYWGRASRVEAVRGKGASEEEIQRGLALFRTVRNLCWWLLVIVGFGAIWLFLTK